MERLSQKLLPPRSKKKPGVPPRRGKKLRNHLKNVVRKLRDAGPLPLKQAVMELKKLKRAKFDETVEVHINLGIDVTQSDQMVRGAIPLPHGIGKSVRVAVFCQGENVAKAKAAGGDFVGGADLVEKVQKEGFLDFDVAIATQDMMSQVSAGSVRCSAPAASCRLPRPAPWSRPLAIWPRRSASSRPARSSTAPTRPVKSTRVSAR